MSKKKKPYVTKRGAKRRHLEKEVQARMGFDPAQFATVGEFQSRVYGVVQKNKSRDWYSNPEIQMIYNGWKLAFKVARERVAAWRGGDRALEGFGALRLKARHQQQAVTGHPEVVPVGDGRTVVLAQPA